MKTCAAWQAGSSKILSPARSCAIRRHTKMALLRARWRGQERSISRWYFHFSNAVAYLSCVPKSEQPNLAPQIGKDVPPRCQTKSRLRGPASATRAINPTRIESAESQQEYLGELLVQSLVELRDGRWKTGEVDAPEVEIPDAALIRAKAAAKLRKRLG